MEGMSIFFGSIAGLLMIVLAILAVLIPFFILKIRNETVAINKKLSTVITLLEDQKK